MDRVKVSKNVRDRDNNSDNLNFFFFFSKKKCSSRPEDAIDRAHCVVFEMIIIIGKKKPSELNRNMSGL